MRFKNGAKILSFFVLVTLVLSVVSAFLPEVKGEVYHTVTFNDSTGGIIKFRYVSNPITVYGAGTYSIVDGRALTISNVPASGYQFAYYSFTYAGGSGTTAVSPLSTQIYMDFVITAVFVSTEVIYDLDLIAGNEGGNVYGSWGANYHVTGENWNMAEGSLVDIEAQANLGYQFRNFVIDDGTSVWNYSGSVAYSFTATDNYAVTAYFDVIEGEGDLVVTLSVWAYTTINSQLIMSNAGGSITVSYDPFNDGVFNTTFTDSQTTSRYIYLDSRLLFLAFPNAGYDFKGWFIAPYDVSMSDIPYGSVDVELNAGWVVGSNPLELLTQYTDDFYVVGLFESPSDSGGSDVDIVNSIVLFFIPVIVICIFGFLGYWLMGAYGALVGVNLSVFLLYALTAYMPFIGVIGIIVCDALLFVGKITLGRGGG